jgi:hypothetical protein
MRGLLKYAFVLIFGIAIGGYIGLGPFSLDAPAPSSAERSQAVAPIKPAASESVDQEVDSMIAARLASPAAAGPAEHALSASIDEDLDYMVAKRLASLERWRAFLAAHGSGPYAQSARAEIDRLLRAESALAPRDAQVSDGEASHPSATTDSPDLVSSNHGQTAPAMTGTAASTDGSQDAKLPNETARPTTPFAGADGAPGTQLAALTPDEICQHDGERLEQLRSHPSSNELVRFANELGCQKLLPEIVSLMKSLTPAQAAPDFPSSVSLDAQAGREEARSAPPGASSEVAGLTSDESCKRDEERLVRLRATPSGDEALRFASELGCEKLRPQLQRLMESLDFSEPTPPPAADPPYANPLLGQACVGERSSLDRLRQEPSAETAELFWRNMQCEGLRPQVRLLLESLNIAPDSVASTAAPSEPEARGATSGAPTAVETDPICRQETEELNRVRATPDLSDAKRFANGVKCGALRPQVARLLESLGE